MSKRFPGMGTTTAAMIALLGGGLSAKAAERPADNGHRHAAVSLIAESTCIRPGSVSTIGIHFVIESGWHVYWNGRNDTGFAPEVEWTLPAGVTVEALQWPTPVRHVSPGDILDHVYEDHVTLLVPLKITGAFKPDAKSDKPDKITIKAKVKYLVCDEACVPEDASITLTLPYCTDGTPERRSTDAPKFAEARNRLPVPLTPESRELTSKWTKDGVALRVIGTSGLTFFPAADCAELESPITSAHTTASELNLRPTGDPAPIRGILEVRRPAGKPAEFYTIDIPPPKSRDPGPKPIGAPGLPNPR